MQKTFRSHFFFQRQCMNAVFYPQCILSFSRFDISSPCPSVYPLSTSSFVHVSPVSSSNIKIQNSFSLPTSANQPSFKLSTRHTPVLKLRRIYLLFLCSIHLSMSVSANSGHYSRLYLTPDLHHFRPYPHLGDFNLLLPSFVNFQVSASHLYSKLF